MKPMNPFRRRVRRACSALRIAARIRCLCNEAGGALVELAVFLAFLAVPLIAGIAYTGTLLIDQIDIDNAAYAGAMYAMTSSTFAEDTSNIQTAAQEDSSRFGTNLTVTPTIFYACSLALTGTTYTTQAAATTACTGGLNHPLELVKVVASASVTPPLKIPGVSASKTLSSTVIMEVEE